MDGSRFINSIGKIESNNIVRAIRDGLINIIPVLIIGAFALIFKSFPIKGYQTFITNFLGGFLLDFFDVIYSATFGVLSLYMTFSISRSYMKQKTDGDVVKIGAIIASLLSFFVLAGAYLPDFSTENLGPKSMFLAIITGICASELYYQAFRFFRKKRRMMFSNGATRDFNRMLSTFIPIVIVTLVFAFVNTLVMRIFSVDSFRLLIARMFNAIFSIGDNVFIKGFFFVFLSSVLWFFGIHGSDILEGVMQEYFAPVANQAAQTVLTKEFFDCFVLMGGCGATICLLIAILIFSRNRARRGLGITATFPMLFNINELMVFGLPIIFNPIMLIPFLLVPLVCFTTSYIAISTGLVPMIASSVEWTTPVLLGGYLATGSIAGSVLQLVNIALGVAIYFPFVLLMDKQAIVNNKRDYESFIDYFKANESEMPRIRLLELGNTHGEFAKDLAAELQHGLKSNLYLAYQPQYNYEGKCIGVESLLRWYHPTYGTLYPPLVIKLAEEANLLAELEELVLTQALDDRSDLIKKYGEGIKLSINVTGATVISQRYIDFCYQLDKKESFKDKNICIEITEQEVLSFNQKTRDALRNLHELGFLLAIDDFSMGQTSINYLKDGLFDIIKLDGSLVSGMFKHQNGIEIVSSIVKLAQSVNMVVIAEFVETEEERDELNKLGCHCYQGYLYSKAEYLKEVK